ncbi:TPA: hypothetical protein ACF2ZB_004717, partial [Yersinia enterocolitica]
MKNEIRCPVCGLNFNPRIPLMHIEKHHKGAKDCDLAKIRDARRKCFTEPTAKKSGGKTCLPQVAKFAAGFRNVREDCYHVIK